MGIVLRLSTLAMVWLAAAWLLLGLFLVTASFHAWPVLLVAGRLVQRRWSK